jgi:transcriptional regulator GlxA family with amidase domain
MEELADRVEVSVRQLQRLFKTQTGESPLAYARRMRLKTAAWLLTDSDRTVADIAATCGFSDASHMGREFRREYGVAPNVYRAARGNLPVGARGNGETHAARRSPKAAGYSAL